MSYPPPYHDGGRPLGPHAPGGGWAGPPPMGGPAQPAGPYPGVPPPGDGQWPSPAPGDPGDPGGLQPADWRSRALARLLDAAIVGLPAVIIAAIVGAAWVGGQVVLSETGLSSGGRNFGIIFGIVLFLLFVGYDTVCIRRWGRTPGKAALRLRVAVPGGSGLPGEVSIPQVLVRAGVFHLINLFMWTHAAMETILGGLFLVFIVLWPLWDQPLRQSGHDKIARTVVLREP
ncbi:RDD family protein [Marinactinospora rubrisoli]|uniref:RDD family protein n=1 Tax=Marinactinospora rubrisoli TaxID=2715399 RepID=A0ABW2KNK4_9ACTN